MYVRVGVCLRDGSCWIKWVRLGVIVCTKAWNVHTKVIKVIYDFRGVSEHFFGRPFSLDLAACSGAQTKIKMNERRIVSNNLRLAVYERDNIWPMRWTKIIASARRAHFVHWIIIKLLVGEMSQLPLHHLAEPSRRVRLLEAESQRLHSKFNYRVANTRWARFALEMICLLLP